jgi:glycosyltransferase involved in cell wall biosynthesis
MKILHLFDLFTPYGGGTVDLLYKLSKAQAQRGHEVAIYAGDYKIDRNYVASLPDVKVSLFRCPSSSGGFYFMPGIIPALRDNLKNFDIIHIHTARNFQNIVAHHYAKKYDVPYVLDTHGSLPRAVQGKKEIKPLLKYFFDVAFGYRILRDAHKVVAETQVGISEYRYFGVEPERIVLIPPPFDTAAFSVLPPPGRFREQYQFGDKKVIMFLGRIHWIKGIDFLVESFAELARSRNDVVLVIVGNDDGYKATLEDLISRLGIVNKVLFTGFLGGINKLEALVDADVVIQTSRYEQGAWAPFEAVLCGTPIIVSSNSGAGEDVHRIDAGYLVEFGNINDLKEKMKHVIDNREEAITKTRLAKKYIEENMSIEKGIEKYENLYQSIIGR